ncbi:MAG: prmC [Candidatus Doudnabacteria bacterium]|nr:prmC [Candidatus Doudnabacteria bacterium]
MNLQVEKEIILSEITGKSKEFLIAHQDFVLNKKQSAGYKKMLSQLQRGNPLAYVVGYKWFFGNKFTVTKNVLIPRPETEQLVERAIQLNDKATFKKVIDVGVGSGAIIISLGKTLNKLKADFYGIDISSKALAIAKKNSKNILKNSSIKFVKGNLINPLAKKLSGQQKVLITANLPYLSKKELREPTIKKEPRLALYGGKNSYDLIEKFIKQVSLLDLKQSVILLEINYNQAKALSSKIKKYLPNADIKIHQDFSKFDRIIEITLA